MWSTQAEVIEYRGHRYRRYPNGTRLTHRRYFYATEPRRGFLHRHMWEDAFGPIPARHDIHHKDGNWDNNTIDNFECVTKAEHRARHPLVGESLEKQLAHLAQIREQAAEWHCSDAGRAWHSAHGRAAWIGRGRISKVCAACGDLFEAAFDRARFCSPGCKQRGIGGGPSRRGRYVAEGEAVACKCCHRLFRTKWPDLAFYCSKACGMRYRNRGAFGEGESPKPHRKPRAHILCERVSEP